MNSTSRLRSWIVALAVAGMALPALLPTAASADTAGSSPSLAQLSQQLADDQAKLNDLNNQVEGAQGALDLLNHKLADDQQRESDLNKQLTMMGRVEYEQPALSLSSILEARSLEQLLTDIAQARLVAHKQQNLLGQARGLHRQDEQARNQMAEQLNRVQKARDDAAQVAARTQAMRDSAQDAATKARAAAVAAQASATQAPVPAPGPRPVTAPFPNHFAYGYCTWWVANQRPIPWFGNAIEWWPNAAAYGYAEGPTPRVGAVMVTRESAVGHVAYVIAVNGSSFTVSEMNYTSWDVVDQRTIQLGGSVPIVGFIY
jgi:surface antigen